MCQLEQDRADESQSFLCINGINKLKVKNYVGIIETPNVNIEVLPKITEKGGLGQSRQILKKMLACYLNLPERVANETDLERYNYPLRMDNEIIFRKINDFLKKRDSFGL
ncbi:MAG: hypothetical protein U1F28_02650 [Acinetobacter sp.]